MNLFAPLAWLGRTAHNGVQAAGHAIGKGVGAGVRQVQQLPQRLGMEADARLLRTPDFNPAAASLPPAVAHSVGPPPTTPTATQPLTRVPDFNVPAASRPRSVAETRFPDVAALDFGVSPNRPVTPAGTASESLFRREVNAPFEPQPDPLEATRRSAVVGRYEQAQAPGGRRKLALQNAGIGALEGIAAAYRANPQADWRALLAAGAGGGAVAGFGSALSPARGAEYQVDETVLPHLQRTELRRQQQQERVATQRRGQLEEENLRTQIAGRARESERQDLELATRSKYWDAQSKNLEAETRLRDAQTTAAALGRPVSEDIAEADGIYTYHIYPDGRRVKLGQSANAAYQRMADATSRANTATRAAASERNAERRQASGTGAKKTKEYVSRAEVQQFADANQLTFEEALTKVLNEGYTLTPDQ